MIDPDDFKKVMEAYIMRDHTPLDIDRELNTLNKPWQQAQELAQAGKMDEAVALYETNVVKAPNPIDAVLRPHVKKTADELPDEYVIVLLWHHNEWIHVHRNSVMEWDYNYDAYKVCDIEDGQYWLPLPTFNPESET